MRFDAVPRSGTSVALSVRDYGAVGDGVTDDTVAIQAAFDAAKTAKRPVLFPAPVSGQFYKLTAAISVSRRGQVIRGENAWYCIVKQTTAAEHAFTIVDDADSGGTNTASNQHVIFENLRILGLGAGTATGYGVNGAGDGDWFVMRNCTVQGFARGVFLDGWAQVLFDTTVLHFNGICCYTAKVDSAANTISWLNSGCAHASTIGWLHEGGGGCAVTGGDWVEQPLAMQLGTGTGTGAQVTIQGANFEAVTGSGTEFIQVKAGTRLTAIGCQAQLVDGVDADFINVTGGAVHVIDCILSGMTTGTAGKVLVRKAASTDVATVLGSSATNLGTTAVARAVGDPSTLYAHAQFPQRADNAIPTAAEIYRGLMLQGMGRDATSVQDTLSWYGRDRRSGSDVFLRFELSGRLPSVSATWDPASVASGAATTTTITVTGAVLGDLAIASFSIALPAGVVISAAVTATDTVTVTLANLSGSAQDLASGTVRTTVIKR